MAVLGEQPAVGPDVGDRAPYRSRHLVGQVVGAEPASHVGDVDAPAVESLAQPSRNHRVRAVVEASGQLGRGVVELGQRGDVEPRDVGVPVVTVAEPVEAALGAGRVGARPLEPVVLDPGVVGGQVAHDADADGLRGVQQPAERCVAAEQRVHALERDGVVAMVGARLEDRRQVEQRGAEVGQVAQPPGDAVEGAAVELERHVRAAGARPGRPTRPGSPKRAAALLSRSARSGRGTPGSRPGPPPSPAAGARC